MYTKTDKNHAVVVYNSDALNWVWNRVQVMVNLSRVYNLLVPAGSPLCGQEMVPGGSQQL